MFITFEGIDGCGKTTQIKLLAEYLQNNDKAVTVIREPGGTKFAENIREILLNSKHNINSISELLLFESARADLTEKVIIPALKRGEFVLSDRFYDSTTAYQGYGRQIDLKTIESLNSIGSLGLVPDITFYLEISLDISHKRSKNKVRDRMESAGDDFFKRVVSGFSEIAKNNKSRFKVIDANKSIQETNEKIIEIINCA